jgi:DNA topoisomerase-6 subunit B
LKFKRGTKLQTIERNNPDIVELSVSAWFYRNRAIAGFDNPARSLYVSIRELVENSLDACESSGFLPGIRINLQRVERIEESEDLFQAGPRVFRLEISDNGSGIPRENIPNLLGKMLTGTKFMHRQSRGTFGLGGSLALLYGQVTTQEPIEILSGLTDCDYKTHLRMKLDIENNEPVILHEEKTHKLPYDHGTNISFFLQGDWLRSKKRIIEYLYQTSIIVPYASIRFEGPDDEVITFDRLVEKLPKPPREMKPHPYGIDVEMLKQMAGNSRTKTLKAFMKTSFQRVGSTKASEFLSFAGLEPDKPPNEVSDSELVNMMNSLTAFNKFLAPSSDSLSPAGEDVLLTGMNRLNPLMSAIRTRPASVYNGHPFIVETGVAFGGALESGVQLYRFANRIPLLYDERTDVSSRVIRNLKLKNYGFKQDDPLAFFVHICSTRIPYKTVGKEFIADVDSVRREIDLGLKDCLRRLGKSVRKQQRVQKAEKREIQLQDYYEFIAGTLGNATGRNVSVERLFDYQEGKR